MQFVDDSHYDTCFNEDVAIYKPSGEPLMVLLKGALSQENVSRAWAVLQKVNLSTDNRPIATGINQELRKRADGSIGNASKVPPGWSVMSGIIGYFERTVRLPYARACGWNQHNPEKFAELFPMIREVDSLFKKFIPKRYAVQETCARRTPVDWLITGSVFTTLTVNKNFRTACHKDAGDLAEGFSCMSVIRQGKYNGGRLVLPDWRIAAELDTFDLVMFDAHEFHGNTQIVPLTKNAVRCSIVYYFREMMQKCLPAIEELERAKKRKTGDPLYE